MAESRRKDDFKRGLGDKPATARRERAADRVTEQRGLRRRFVVESATPTTAGAAVGVDLAALVERGDTTQLRILSETVARLGERDNGELDRALPTLITPAAVHALVRFHREHPDPAVRQAALGTLVNLTTLDTTMSLAICNAIVRAEFLELGAPAAPGASAGCVDPAYWDVVINVALSCPPACDEIQASSLMVANGVFEQTLKACPPQSAMAMSMQILIFALLHPPNCPWRFVRIVWPFLVARQAPYALQPMPFKELGHDQQMMRSNVLYSVYLTLRRASANDDGSINELLDPCFVPLLQLITYVVPHANIMDELHIMDIFNQISGAAQRFQPAMEAVPGCIAYMVRSLQCPDSRLRASAFLWLGNYVADGTVYVWRALDELAVMPMLLHAVRIGELNYPHVRRNAIHALMAMFEACYEEFQHNLGTSQRADQIMDKLVRGNRIFRHIVPFLSVGGTMDVMDRAMTLNILSIINDALKWNRTKTLEQLHDDGEAEGRVSAILANVKGKTQDNELFYAAAAVEDRMEGRDPELRMEVAEQDRPVEGLGTDGVYQGGFSAPVGGGAGSAPKYNF